MATLEHRAETARVLVCHCKQKLASTALEHRAKINRFAISFRTYSRLPM